MTALFRPVRVFFDTNHLVEMAQLRKGNKRTVLAKQGKARVDAYRNLATKMSQGFVTPVAGGDQVDEWFKGSEAGGALEIAGVLDESKNCLLCSGDHYVFFREVVSEIGRLAPQFDSPLPSVFYRVGDADMPLAFLMEKLPTLRDAWARTGMPPLACQFRSVRHLVESTRPSITRDLQRGIKRHASFHLGFGEMKEDLEVGANHVESVKKRILRSPILQEYATVTGFSSQLGELMARVDLGRCPGTKLWAAMWWRFVKGRPRARDNDHFDLSYVPFYPYVDYALIEGPMARLVQAADRRVGDRVFYSVDALVQRLSDAGRAIKS